VKLILVTKTWFLWLPLLPGHPGSGHPFLIFPLFQVAWLNQSDRPNQPWLSALTMRKSYQIDWGVYQSHLISLDDEMRHANYEYCTRISSPISELVEQNRTEQLGHSLIIRDAL